MVLKPSRKHAWVPLHGKSKGGDGAEEGAEDVGDEGNEDEGSVDLDDEKAAGGAEKRGSALAGVSGGMGETAAPAPAAGAAASSGGAAAGAAAGRKDDGKKKAFRPTVMRIALKWADVELEPKPFARGGGGQIFRGTYNGSAVAAKQLLMSSSEEEELADFEREVIINAQTPTHTRKESPKGRPKEARSDDSQTLQEIAWKSVPKWGITLSRFTLAPEPHPKRFVPSARVFPVPPLLLPLLLLLLLFLLLFLLSSTFFHSS